jgi:hypothetical protein
MISPFGSFLAVDLDWSQEGLRRALGRAENGTLLGLHVQIALLCQRAAVERDPGTGPGCCTQPACWCCCLARCRQAAACQTVLHLGKPLKRTAIPAAISMVLLIATLSQAKNGRLCALHAAVL